MDEKRAALLLGSPERRAASGQFEIRTDGGDGDTFSVRGYASVVEHGYEVYGGPDRGGWIETIARDAFGTTLAAKPDVSFLINHEGMPLARTKSGTLALRADNTGLESEADISRRDPEGAGLEVKMQRGDMDQMSFGFRVTRQEWNEDYTERRIGEVNLDKGDVSIVNWPANPATSIGVVSARSAVDFIRTAELCEIRADITAEELREARERLDGMVAALAPGAEEREGEPAIEVAPASALDVDRLAALVERMEAVARTEPVEPVLNVRSAIELLQGLEAAEAGELEVEDLMGLRAHLAQVIADLTPTPQRGMSRAEMWRLLAN